MKFTTAASFRASLETRLLTQARTQGRDVNRLRTQVAFERFLLRVFTAQQSWVLKGGYALEVRLQDRARSTLDLDLNATAQLDLLGTLQRAAAFGHEDHFEFTIRTQGVGLAGPPEGGQRFHVEARLAGRPFSRFHVDIALGDVLTAEPEWMPGQVDLSFASLPPTSLRVYPLVSHFAEKVHAYTRPRERQTRVKDLVDLALLLTLELKADPLAAQALVVTFDRYDTHPLPVVWPSAPKDWADPFRTLAEQTGLESPEIQVWQTRLAAFWTQLDVFLSRR
ncbi:nucleotidyl transferase AbiEii/AbiGii toxin family protein [Deinococcus alpinitundrae]|uniref:nucleotidyl transferase AbiEii/AbiGii toxin family protein n=1 Tax=Deinococcus alpinitundrae TaxID=468913 RepID=UPI00137AD1E3|nr:nucleotidyl transferase AbiEii/AbiGii toxin family protein [Deinococcus alpinitundrae]